MTADTPRGYHGLLLPNTHVDSFFEFLFLL